MTYVGQLICRDGTIAAITGATRFFLAPDIETLPTNHPERRLVVLMCEYARRVDVGTLPGPYSDQAAEEWARFALWLVETPIDQL